MKTDGKPADLSFIAALLWFRLGGAGACLLLLGVWTLISMISHWQLVESRHVVMVSVFLLLGAFGVFVATRWYRRLYLVERKRGSR